ncbi:hypothetical protein S40288_11716 [Stachybotrys chartarum IBT 40288]|nr:hypothetical protein S40288_11716 [Stachybotrys chartarum IBT 40288]
MSNSAVGFGFQTDVVGMGSVMHLLTGRLLKTLSDGGVDAYAVASSIWLGTQFKTRSELEATVHPHLEARLSQGFQGFLAKTLSIGWGHSSAAVEMSRTKAGTNSLLLIGALAAGSPPFFAAQCLSELLSSHGCGADQIPNVDRLKGMVVYLAPIVQDIAGFSKVLQQITTTGKVCILNRKFEDDSDASSALCSMGEPRVLAAAVKQLCFTSQRLETVYFTVKQRGSWLAAFAGHILGMSVRLLSGECVLWECGGSNGNAVFQLQDSSSRIEIMQYTSRPKFLLIPAPSAKEAILNISIDYALDDAFSAMMQERYNQQWSTMSDGILNAFARMSIYAWRTKHLWGQRREHFYKGGLKSLLLALCSFGIDEDRSKHALSWVDKLQPSKAPSEDLGGYNMWDFMDSKYQAKSSNSTYGDDDLFSAGLSNRLMGFVVLVQALARCRFIPSEVRIQRHNFSRWDDYKNHCDLMVYLSGVLGYTQPNFGYCNESLLGVSDRNTAIFFTCLVDDSAAYDDFGRLVTIASGFIRGFASEWDGRQSRQDNNGSRQLAIPPSPTFQYKDRANLYT